METFSELAKTRQSCRSFTGEEVPRALLEQCFEAARLSPSACNSQPWRFYAVTDPALRGETVKAVQHKGMNGFASDAGALIVVCETKAALKPVVASGFDSQHFARMDLGMTVSYFTLAAAELGLGTCILGWMDEGELRTTLSLPEDVTPRLVLAVGIPKDGTVREKKRKDLDEVRKYL